MVPGDPAPPLTDGIILFHEADVFARLAAVLACGIVLAGCGLLGQPVTERLVARSNVAKIAYIGSDDHVYVADADGSSARRITQRVDGLSTSEGWTYRWPTYSPDGRRLAFAAYRSQAGSLLSTAILGADADKTASTVLLESQTLAPIYLYWSPDNRHVAALVQSARTLELQLLDATGAEQARRVATGNPLYWSWGIDGQTLAVHIGGDGQSNPDAWVGLLHIDGQDVREERFAETPGGFRAPAWSPSGDKLAYAGVAGGQSLLSVRDANGQISRVASSATDLAFSWAPGGDWLAFASVSPDAQAIYDGIDVARPDGAERHRLSQDPQVSFYWAPDGKRLALLGLNRAARALEWSTVQVDGKARRVLTSFSPSNDFAFQLPFFDQYAQSTSIWSPDGKKLVYGAEGGDERTDGSASGERVMVLEVDGQAGPAAVAQGGVAVWSPAR
jgi:Tol biopolymer transport system component